MFLVVSIDRVAHIAFAMCATQSPVCMGKSILWRVAHLVTRLRGTRWVAHRNEVETRMGPQGKRLEAWVRTESMD